MTAKRREPLKIDMSFEDALEHVLSVGPMPKDEKPIKRSRRTPARKAQRKPR